MTALSQGAFDRRAKILGIAPTPVASGEKKADPFPPADLVAELARALAENERLRSERDQLLGEVRAFRAAAVAPVAPVEPQAKSVSSVGWTVVVTARDGADRVRKIQVIPGTT